MTHPNATARLTAQQRKTLFLASLGGALEFYDFVVFVFFATTMGALFFPPDMPAWLKLVQTFGIFAAGYLARPLGGIVMAHFGDITGRKRMFMLSILLMAIPTLLMGLLPTYAQIGVAAPILLLVLRLMQGAAIGGEAPGAWVFVSEHVAANRRNFACGALSLGLLAGILLGSLVALALNTQLDEARLLAWGWRVPFLLGGVFGLLALQLRRRLHETPVFAELKAQQQLARELPLKAVLREHGFAVLMGMLLTWLLTAAVVVTLLMMPTFLQGMGVPRGEALLGNALAIFAAMAANLLAGALADRFGAGRILMVWSLMLGGTFSGFFLAAQAGHYTHLLYVLAGSAVGLTAMIPAIALSGFPAQVRFTGLSFSYNVAYAIAGGLTPVLLSLAMKSNPTAPVHYILAMAVLGLVLGGVVQAREARRNKGAPR
jgi:MFS family permease